MLSALFSYISKTHQPLGRKLILSRLKPGQQGTAAWLDVFLPLKGEWLREGFWPVRTALCCLGKHKHPRHDPLKKSTHEFRADAADPASDKNLPHICPDMGFFSVNSALAISLKSGASHLLNGSKAAYTVLEVHQPLRQPWGMRGRTRGHPGLSMPAVLATCPSPKSSCAFGHSLPLSAWLSPPRLLVHPSLAHAGGRQWMPL